MTKRAMDKLELELGGLGSFVAVHFVFFGLHIFIRSALVIRTAALL